MRLLSIFLAAALLAPCLTASAWTENAAPPPPFGEDRPVPALLKSGDYTRSRESGGDTGWLRKDSAVFFAEGSADDPLPPYTVGKGRLRIILWLRPGEPLPGGLSVGSPAADVIRRFGKVYPYSRADIYQNEPDTGMYTENTFRAPGGKEFRCWTLTYFDKNGRWVQFLIDRDTKKIALCAAWEGGSLRCPGTAAADALSAWGLWRLILGTDKAGGELRF